MKHAIHYLAMALVCVMPTAAQAGSCSFRSATYFKSYTPYVAPTYVAPVATVYALPVIQLFSVGPGYYAPPPPAAVVPAATAVSPCDAKIAALAAEFKLLREENQQLKGALLQFQQQGRPAPQQLPQKQENLPPPQAAPKGNGDLSWLTGAKGCASCHSGPQAVKGIDYTKGLGELSAKNLGRTIKVLDEKTMPPDDQKAYADRGLQGPHPKPTQEQLNDFASALAELRK